jgi:hypothetical protein
MSGDLPSALNHELDLAIAMAYEARGAARERALDRLAEAEETVHRRAMEQRQLDLRSRGQIIGFIITILWFAAALIIGLKADPWAGTVLASLNVVPLVTLFVTSRQPPETPPPPAPEIEREKSKTP